MFKEDQTAEGKSVTYVLLVILALNVIFDTLTVVAGQGPHMRTAIMLVGAMIIADVSASFKIKYLRYIVYPSILAICVLLYITRLVNAGYLALLMFEYLLVQAITLDGKRIEFDDITAVVGFVFAVIFGISACIGM